MAERHPVDRYSKPAYEEGIAQLSQVENNIKEHPLQAELDIHRGLKKDSPSPYPLREDEAKLRAAFEAETAEFRAEIDRIKKDLWRQLGNAQTEATKMNDEIESKKLAQAVLSQIIEIEDSTHHTMENSGNLPRRAQVFGRAVLEEAEATKQKITARKPTPAPETIQNSLKVIQELYRQFADMAGNVLVQDRYGRAAT